MKSRLCVPIIALIALAGCTGVAQKAHTLSEGVTFMAPVAWGEPVNDMVDGDGVITFSKMQDWFDDGEGTDQAILIRITRSPSLRFCDPEDPASCVTVDMQQERESIEKMAASLWKTIQGAPVLTQDVYALTDGTIQRRYVLYPRNDETRVDIRAFVNNDMALLEHLATKQQGPVDAYGENVERFRIGDIDESVGGIRDFFRQMDAIVQTIAAS